MLPVMMAGALASSAIGGIMGGKAAKAQRKAAEAQARLQAEMAAKSRAANQQVYDQGMGLSKNTYDTSLGNTNRLFDVGRSVVNTGYDTATGAINQGYGGAIDTLQPFASPNALYNLYDMAGVARPGETTARPYDFTTDPSYQWRFNEGQRALDQSAASRGMLLSGTQAKAAQRYGQGAASQEYGAQFNRLAGLAQQAQSGAGNLATLQRGQGTALADLATGRGTALSNLATGQSTALNNLGQQNVANQTGLGQNYVSNLTNINQNQATGQGQAIADAGQARASGYLSMNNAIQNGLSGLTQMVGTYGVPYSSSLGSMGLSKSYFPASNSTVNWNAGTLPGAPPGTLQIPQSGLMNPQGQYPMGLL